MTETTDKLRAVFLAALMVVSVFAGTIAFAGSAAAEVQDASVVDTSIAPGDSATVTVNNGTEDDNVVVVASQNNTFESSADFSGTSSTSSNQDTVDVSVSFGADASPGDYNVYVANGSADPSEDANLDDWNNVTASETIHVVNDSRVIQGSADEDLATPGSFWSGQTLFFKGDAANASMTYQIWSVNDDGNGLADPGPDVNLDENSEAIIGTSNLDSDEYVLVNDDREVVEVGNNGEKASTHDTSSAGDYSFLVREQEFSADFDGDTVQNDPDGASTVPWVIDDDRGSMDVVVEWDGDADADEMDSAFASQYTVDYFNTDDWATVSDGDDADAVRVNGIQNNHARELNFSGVPADDYNFTFTVEDTAVTADDSLTVQEPADGNADIAVSDGVVTEARGDYVAIPIELSGATSEANVTIGGSTDGFQTSRTLVDGNNDGQVTLLFNTYASTGANVHQGLVAAADDDTEKDGNTPIDVDNPIAAGDYDLSVSVNGDEKDVATLVVDERSTTGSAAYTAPVAADITDLEAQAALGASTSDSDVAEMDYAVAQFNASGLGGYFGSVAEFNGSANANGLSVEFEQVNPIQNQDPITWNASAGNVTVLDDTITNDTFVVAWRVDEGQTTGDYNATFHINASANEVTAENETFTETFTVEEREVELNGDETWTVDTDTNQTLEGETSAAPGTELTVRARATGDNPFLKPQTMTVQDDGTFSAEYDFSDAVNGTEFSVTPSSGANFDYSIGGVVVEGSGEEPTTETPEPTTDTPEPTTDTPEPTTDTPEPTDTTEPMDDTTEPMDDNTDEPTTTGGQAGFGLVVSLIALLGAAFVALRRRN